MPSLRLLSLLLATLAAFGCSSSIRMVSEPAIKPPVADGTDSEWGGKTYSIEKTGISIGFQHTNQFLFLCMKTSDRGIQMQIARDGLQVWFDPQGGNDKIAGIRYPIPVPPDMLMHGANDEPGEMTGGVRGEMPGEPGAAPDREGPIARMPFEKLTECEILSDNPSETRIEPLGADRIQAKMKLNNGVLVYELQIPLGEPSDGGFPLAWNTQTPLGIGLLTSIPELSEPMRSRKRAGMNDEMRGGDRSGGMHGGFPGGTQGGMGEMRMGMPGAGSAPQPLDLWITLRPSATH